MKSKKVIPLMLCGVLAGSLLTGCGTGKEAGAGTEKDSSVSESTGSGGSASNTNSEEPYTVKILAYGDGTTEAANAVAEAISEKTMELYNIRVEIMKGYTVDQLNLMLTSGEKLDLFPVMPWELSLSSLVNNGQIYPMDDLLAQYGKEMYDSISQEDWACTSLTDKYGAFL